MIATKVTLPQRDVVSARVTARDVRRTGSSSEPRCFEDLATLSEKRRVNAWSVSRPSVGADDWPLTLGVHASAG
jgi:hypothetical protein